VTMNQVIPANLIDLGRLPQNPQEQAKAKRILKTYGWTWDMYWALGVKQGWRCAICGRTATSSALNGQLDGLNIDHTHFKVLARRLDPVVDRALFGLNFRWLASTTVNEHEIQKYAKTKQVAIDAVKADALPLSVRGLLCPGRHGKAGQGCCNRLLGRVDNPDWLEKARNYLLNPPAKNS
jgi:hypothetical protein